MSSSNLLANCFLQPCHLQKISYKPKHLINPTRVGKQISDTRSEEIVIVGGGVGGLATALALHRIGVPCLVLEQSSALSNGWGTQLTIFKNGWNVLDMLGVGDELRSQFLQLQGVSVRTSEGKEIRTIDFKDVDLSQELRSVEKGALLRTLANKLPKNSIQFSSKLANIRQDDTTGENKLELTNGGLISAKIVIGCDGVRSPIARWMGFPEPKYAGHCAFRGLSCYSQGRPNHPRVNYICGSGVRAGFIPVSSTAVYWFICYNSSTSPPDSRVITVPSELKRLARELVKNWPPELLKVIDETPDDMIIRSSLEDRWLWPIVTPPVSKGRVVLLGDAWHPMTPNLGLGGCCALEDAVVLASKLSKAVHSQGSVEDALRAYGNERWSRVFSLTALANVAGGLMQWDNHIVCSLRNGFVIPKLLEMGSLLGHTNFASESLQFYKR
ncbi:hypothetical protein vseg_020358 [Gypsophila vaccaria]